MQRKPIPISPCVLAALLSCACADSPTQDPLWSSPSGAPNQDAASQSGSRTQASGALQPCGAARQFQLSACSRAERELRAGDEAALGFAADAFTRLISGEHRALVAWWGEGAPSDRRSELVLTVQPRGPVHFVEQSVVSGARETYTGNTGAQYFTCGDRLAVDAQISIVTPDGALNETVDASVEADSAGYALVSVREPASSVAGSLRPTLEQRGADALGMAFGISELGTGLEGTLGLISSNGDQPGEGCSTLGDFSLAQGCPLGSYPLDSEAELRGLSFAGALALLNATSPAALDDAGQLSLHFTASAAQQCLSIDTPARLPAVLEFPGNVQLSSSDGRIGGSLDVQLTAQALDGQLQQVNAQTEYLVPSSDGLAELAPDYAILQPLVWSELEPGGFEFQLEARAAASGGLLRALGGNLGCQGTRPCEEVCPGPGCTMTTAEKWGVHWGDKAIGSDLPRQAARD